MEIVASACVKRLFYSASFPLFVLAQTHGPALRFLTGHWSASSQSVSIGWSVLAALLQCGYGKTGIAS